MPLEVQNNPFPSILMVEAADETDPTPDALPAVGSQRLIVGPDHLLYLLDDTGAATLVGGGGGDITTDAAWAAKGDLIVGSANDTAVIKTVGANDTILMADSAATGGVKWVGSQTPSTQAFSDAAAEGTADTYARGDHKHAMPASPGGGGGGLVLLEQHTASSSATLDFTTCISSTYDTYKFVFVGIIPATSTSELRMRVGTGGGPTYVTGTSYGSQMIRWTSAGAAFTGLDSGLTAIELTSGWLSTGVHPIAGEITLYDPGSTALHKFCEGRFVYPASSGSVMVTNVTGGQYNATTAVTAIRFYMTSGNITSGTIRAYGMEK